MDIYKEIQERMHGEIYIGVVGPVRTGKSTFIKRFMELLVIPHMEDEYARARAKDELPLSADGKMVTTTEPKFIPKDEAMITIGEDTRLAVRLIDCVGFMVKGAMTGEDNDVDRKVKTPWSNEEIPFSKAAEIGTQKVIDEHAGIGIVVTTDGSFGRFDREDYMEAEERTIQELSKSRKPFLIILNTENPYSDKTKELVEQLSQKYEKTVVPVNCMQLRKEDVTGILEKILYEFPVARMELHMPKWIEMLSKEHPLKQALVEYAKTLLGKMKTIRQVNKDAVQTDNEYVRQAQIENIDLSNGCVKLSLDVDDMHYYNMLSQLVDMPVQGEYQLLSILKELSAKKKEYDKVLQAMESVRMKGYGVVMPEKQEIVLEEPVVIKHGSKYGVKIKAESPSVHFIRANIQTEIAPIVGNEQQAEDLITYIKENSKTEDGIWNTNIFGKSVEQLVEDGIRNKITMMGEECQQKLQDTMKKIVNDSNGGLVCIII